MILELIIGSVVLLLFGTLGGLTYYQYEENKKYTSAIDTNKSDLDVTTKHLTLLGDRQKSDYDYLMNLTETNRVAAKQNLDKFNLVDDRIMQNEADLKKINADFPAMKVKTDDLPNKLITGRVETGQLSSGGSFLPHPTNNNSYIRAKNNTGNILIGDTNAKKVFVGYPNKAVQVDVGGAAQVRIGEGGGVIKMGKSYFQHGDGNTYIRSKDNGAVVLGGSTTKNINITPGAGGSFSANGKFVTHKGGETHIRGGTHNKVLVGDQNTQAVRLVSEGTNTELRVGPHSIFNAAHGDTYVRPSKSGRQVIIGDTNLTSDIHIGNAATGKIHTYKEIRSSKPVCINNKCITEADVDKLKALP